MALVNEVAPVVDNVKVGPRLYVMTVRAPKIASAIGPGQFVHMRVPGMDDHILRRPFSVYARDADAGTLDILYQTVGFGSRHMTELKAGAETELIGPVGHGWQRPDNARRVMLVAGGVGAAPLFMFAEDLLAHGAKVDVVLGAQTKDALVTRDRYAALLGCEPNCSTDDGSFGRHGFCTAAAEELLANGGYDLVCACGPEPVMRITAGLARSAGVPCQVSLERRMACGVGACLSCVVDTVNGKRRACVDGPVFDASEVVWA